MQLISDAVIDDCQDLSEIIEYGTDAQCRHVLSNFVSLRDDLQKAQDLADSRELLIWSSSSGKIELQIIRQQAKDASHQGQCDLDVLALSGEPMIAAQLATLAPGDVAEELRGYGSWGVEELADHAQNLQRLLWLVCGDLTDGG